MTRHFEVQIQAKKSYITKNLIKRSQLWNQKVVLKDKYKEFNLQTDWVWLCL